LFPRFAVSNPAKDNGFLRDIKIHSTASFVGEVKPFLLHRKIYGMLKNPMSMKGILHRQNSAAISPKVSPASLLVVYAGKFATALVDKREMIRNQMGMHSRSEVVVVQGSPCAPTPQQ
jgi:hypothetical protein